AKRPSSHRPPGAVSKDMTIPSKDLAKRKTVTKEYIFEDGTSLRMLIHYVPRQECSPDRLRAGDKLWNRLLRPLPGEQQTPSPPPPPTPPAHRRHARFLKRQPPPDPPS